MTVKKAIEQLREREGNISDIFVTSEWDIGYLIEDTPEEWLEDETDIYTFYMSEFLIDDHHGIYLPKFFVESYDTDRWHVSKDNKEILLQGPDHEQYWEAWDSVRDNAYLFARDKKWFLDHDRDLRAITILAVE